MENWLANQLIIMKEILLRFIIGGTVVSSFAIVGDIFKPKSSAGLFGAAPSVALANLIVIVLMVIVFVLALLLPFPGRKSDR